MTAPAPETIDGWANIASGDSVVVSFAQPIPNNTGPDLVLLEAHYDVGAYTVSTDHDDFTAMIVASPWVDSGVSRDYWYGLNNGPYVAEIWGAEIDLGDLGVPPDATVTTVRFTAANNDCDPIGLGALVEPVPVELMTLTVE